MPPISKLRKKFQFLDRQWQELQSFAAMPQSMLHVLNYSLSSQGQGEVFMTRMLRYFLDPEEPHGLDDEFLKAFLRGFRSHQRSSGSQGSTFDEDLFDLSRVEVDRQVRLGFSDDSEGDDLDLTGPVDLVVENPGDWYLVIELKFGASENNLRGEGPSQTEAYAQSSHLRRTPLAEYESGGYYLYIRPYGSAPARSDQFSNWTWQDITEDVLIPFIEENAARFPQRTVVQLREVRDDIMELTGMNEHQQNEAEKIELFLEHYELIHDLTETFDARWEEFSNEWGHRFAEVLEEAGYGQGSNIEERVSELELTRGGQTERWMFRAKNSDWAHIFKEGWWRRTDNRSAIMARPDDRNDARVGFYHRLEANRDLALRDETLRFTFRNMGANDDTFIAAFNQALESREGQLARNLPDVADLSTITKTRRDLITAEYSIRPDQHEDFFVAYLAALRQAFCDFVVERRELISLIDEAYIEALEIYEE